ncbi:MAG: GHMP kinase [Candidatus Pacebacteria bacterium]|nr:GHMP kinase [Candidatus Paceibacterota bacterium]
MTVSTSARLHLGFLDLNGSLGRRFGSIGVAIDQPITRLMISPSSETRIIGAQQPRLLSLLPRLLQELGLSGSVNVTLDSAIPSHQGLGSGTQLELALAAGLAALAGSPEPINRALTIIDRGARSGIGMAAFAQGGFLVDGGHKENPQSGESQKSTPPILARYDFCQDWRFILLRDDNDQGLSGNSEKQAFAQLAPMADQSASRLAQLVLMLLLPGLVEQDLTSVADALTEIQTLVGDYFAPAQGGSRFSNPRIAKLLEPMVASQLSKSRSQAYGIGQSSWGPTAFILVESQLVAEAVKAQLISTIRQLSQTDPQYQGLSTVIVRGQNHGAKIEVIP